MKIVKKDLQKNKKFVHTHMRNVFARLNVAKLKPKWVPKPKKIRFKVYRRFDTRLKKVIKTIIKLDKPIWFNKFHRRGGFRQQNDPLRWPKHTVKRWIWFDKRPRYMNKKPYWRRKSYSYINKNKRFLRNLTFKRLKKKQWHLYSLGYTPLTKYAYRNRRSRFLRFLKRHKSKYFYKGKLYLNLFFARLFEFRSRHSLYQFRKFIKQKNRRLSYFANFFFSRLDFVIKRFRLRDWNMWTIRKAQLMIQAGLVLVNFKKVKSYCYTVKSSDCIVLCLGGRGLFGFFWKFYRDFFPRLGKMKYRPGVMLKYHAINNWLLRDKISPRRFFTYLIKFNEWRSKFFKHFGSFYLVSNKIFALISLIYQQGIKFENLFLSNAPLRRFVVYRLVNYFVNMAFN